MNIFRMIENLKRKTAPLIYKITANSVIFYTGFVVLSSLTCILLAELSPNGRFGMWYRYFAEKPVYNKAIQHATGDGSVTDGNRFLTYYRFHEFGGSNPDVADGSAPMIALTFDDGPNPDHTERILRVLGENYSHATFFVVGTNAERYPDVLQAISATGNEIGNHSYSHANLTDIESNDVEEEIEKVNRAVKKATGENTTVIRPPYGAYNDELLGQLMEPVVLWDLDTEDWDSRNAQKITEQVLSKVKDGDIVLMHDIYESTAEAVEILVPRLKEMGYQIVTVSEMARRKGKELKTGTPYGEFEGTAQ